MPLPSLPVILLLLPGPAPAQEPLPPLEQPPRPARTPGRAELDPATGLHMTGKPVAIELAGYRLKVTGKVLHPLSLGFDELRRMPRLASRDPVICRGYFEDYSQWAGASLAAVLDRAGVKPGAGQLTLLSADGYRTWVSLQQARSPYAFLAYEWEGKALPVLHGFPVRAAFPGLPGNKWVKWLVEIRVQ